MGPSAARACGAASLVARRARGGPRESRAGLIAKARAQLCGCKDPGGRGARGPHLRAAAAWHDPRQQLAQAGSIDMLLKAISATGADPNAVTQNVNGKIANPYVEQVFNGIGMRQFDFSWKLVPRSEGEQENIHNLIKKLREHALPEISGKRWLEVPEIFNLRWMNSGRQIESLPKIKPCVLKSVQVQYTPDNVWATHYKGGRADPYPVAYNLSLSFGETAIITSKDVVKGY